MNIALQLALKQPLHSAIENGYANALWTIVDSHVTTLITALALFLCGTDRRFNLTCRVYPVPGLAF